jgi:hypothetical protein
MDTPLKKPSGLARQALEDIELKIGGSSADQEDST